MFKVNFPANMYLFKVKNRDTRKRLKYVELHDVT